MLFGTALAVAFGQATLDAALVARTAVAFGCACLVASFNYMVNEVVDAPFDRQHLTKRQRPLAAGLIRPLPVIVIAVLALGTGVGVSYVYLGVPTALSLSLLALLGLLYNIPPVRLKDKVLLDVVSESANNPTRFFVGWYATGAHMFPPSSIALAYWTIGAFLMTAKRYAELRSIGSKSRAAAYRRSFQWYSEKKLLLIMIMYIGATMFFAGVLVAKYHAELILGIPFVCVFVGWFFYLTLEEDSVVKEPEKIVRRPAFLAYTLIVFLVLVALTKIHLPWLGRVLGIEGLPW